VTYRQTVQGRLLSIELESPYLRSHKLLNALARCSGRRGFVKLGIQQTNHDHDSLCGFDLNHLVRVLDNSSKSRYGRIVYLAPQLAFGLVVLCCLASGLAPSLRTAYPIGALAVGAYLMGRDPASYLAFTIWLWFLSSLVRRLVDHSAGWQDPSSVLLAPYLVSGLSVLPLVRRLLSPSEGQSGVFDSRPLPFVLCGIGVVYGLFVGLISNPLSAVVMDFLYWGIPLMLGWYVTAYPDSHLIFGRAVTRTFQLGLLVMGCYGVYQFVIAPPWDSYWLANVVGVDSMGLPEPYGIRVFSTMNAPAILGLTLASGIVLWFVTPRLLTLPCAAAAFAAILLSQARTAWIVLAIAVLLLIPTLQPKLLVRLTIGLSLVVALALPILMVEPMRTVVSDRLATLTTPSRDESAKDRIEGHRYLFELAVQQPFGHGLGTSEAAFPISMALKDSVVASCFLQLGFFGSAVYFSGLLFLLRELWSAYRRRESTLSTAVACTAIGLLSQMYLATTTAGPVGVFFWIFSGIAVGKAGLAQSKACKVVSVQGAS
jgi:hypothetical protein